MDEPRGTGRVRPADGSIEIQLSWQCETCGEILPQLSVNIGALARDPMVGRWEMICRSCWFAFNAMAIVGFREAALRKPD